MSRRAWLVTGVVAVALVGSCVAVLPPFILPQPVYWLVYGWRYPSERTCGDAVMTDYGPDCGIWRYRLCFDELVISRSQNHVYHVHGKQNAELEIKFNILLNSNSNVWVAPWATDIIARVEVRMASGATFKSKQGVLKEWRWGGPLGSNFRFVASETYVPQGTEDCDVIVDITSTYATELDSAKFVAMGGGWN